jgi:cytochrome c-type biogenesis protein CcmH
MTEFIIAASLLTLLVLGVLIWPLRTAPPALSDTRAKSSSDIRTQLNAQIYRQHKAQLDAQLQSGELDASAHEVAWQELQTRLLQEAQTESAPTWHNPKRTVWALAMTLPVMAAALYAVLGEPQALGVNPVDPMQRAQASGASGGGATGSGGPAVTPDEVERMVAGLADKLEKDPTHVAGWNMLIRSYKALGRLEQAEQAYDRAAPYIAQDAQLLADYADISAANAGGQFTGKPQRLIDQALRVDPKHPLALWLAGTAAFERQDYPQALKQWEKLQTILPPGSEDAKTMALSMERVRAKMSNSPKINQP